MRIQWVFKEKGVTLIELLVALVICGVVIGGIYRLFVVQTKAYTIQDQVVEVQQNVRSAMEVLLRDLRMTGYDDDCFTSEQTIHLRVPTALPTVADQSIAVSYEYHNDDHTSHQLQTVRYWRDAVTSTLFRQRTGEGAEALLEKVKDLSFSYGIDTDKDGDVDSWKAAGEVGTSKIIAVRVTLTGEPDSANPDVQTRVSPRTLTSVVSFRNLIIK